MQPLSQLTKVDLSFLTTGTRTKQAMETQPLLQFGPCITHLKPEAISWHSQILRDLRRGLGEGGQTFT